MGGQRSLGLSFIPLRLGYPSLSVHTPLSFCVHPHYCTRRPVALLMQPMPPRIHRTAAHKYSSAPSHPYARKIWPSREGITTAFSLASLASLFAFCHLISRQTLHDSAITPPLRSRLESCVSRHPPLFPSSLKRPTSYRHRRPRLYADPDSHAVSASISRPRAGTQGDYQGPRCLRQSRAKYPSVTVQALF